jgi:hypothetical protein
MKQLSLAIPRMSQYEDNPPLVSPAAARVQQAATRLLRR